MLDKQFSRVDGIYLQGLVHRRDAVRTDGVDVHAVGEKGFCVGEELVRSGGRVQWGFVEATVASDPTAGRDEQSGDPVVGRRAAFWMIVSC